MGRQHLGQRLVGRIQRDLHRLRFARALRHVSGPRDMPGGPHDVIAITPIRDGAFYLGPFLRHHRALGVAHFVFCDTGSSDDTIARLKREPDVTVFQCNLPMAAFENDMRRGLAERLCPGRWVLYVDTDELFDFTGSANGGLPALTSHLMQGGYTAMIAQMVEMFPKGPIAEYAHTPYDEVIAAYQYCDIRGVHAMSYFDKDIGFSAFLKDNTIASEDIRILFGGIRGVVFGENCCLTKHPLMHVLPGVQPGVHPHCASAVSCADMTAVLRHYKFCNDPFGRDAAAVEAETMTHGEDALRHAVARQDPQLSLWSEGAHLFNLEALYGQGILLRGSGHTSKVER